MLLSPACGLALSREEGVHGRASGWPENVLRLCESRSVVGLSLHHYPSLVTCVEWFQAWMGRWSGGVAAVTVAHCPLLFFPARSSLDTLRDSTPLCSGHRWLLNHAAPAGNDNGISIDNTGMEREEGNIAFNCSTCTGVHQTKSSQTPY